MGLVCSHGNYGTLDLTGIFKRTQVIVYRCPVCGMSVDRYERLRDLDGVETRDGWYRLKKEDREYQPRVLIRSLRGMGDQIYLRPFLREWAKKFEVWVDSSFPELFHDIPQVRVYQLGGTMGNTESLFLRYHKECEGKHKLPFAPVDYSIKEFVTYSMNDLRSGKTILESFNKFVVPEPFDFSLKVKDEWESEARKLLTDGVHAGNYLILKAPTLRKEWMCSSRSPRMDYYWPLVEKARKEGYKIVSMAYLQDGEEWFDGEFRDDLVDIKLHGFLPLGTIIGLFSLSAGVISFPSFALPLCMAIQKKLFLIYGGYVPHKHLVDKRVNHKNIYAVEPSPFCFCMDENHNCKKDINESSISRKFERFLLGR